jgi:hypothetical protein
MKFITLLSLLILLTTTSCVNRGTLYIDKNNAYATLYSQGIGSSYFGVVSPKEYQRIVTYLNRTLDKPILVVGLEKKVNSYKEYAETIGISFPTMLSSFYTYPNKIVNGMDYKDVWLSKGPPISIFILDTTSVTWRYKDGIVVEFVDGKVVMAAAFAR